MSSTRARLGRRQPARPVTLLRALASSGTDVTVTPSVLTGAFATVAPTVTGSSVSTPSVLTGTFALQAPTITGSALASPSVLTGAFAVQSVTVTGGATVSPSVLTGTFAIADPTVSTDGNVTVSPSVLTGSFALAAPTVSGSAPVSVSVVSGAFTIAAPAVTGGATVSPSVDTGTFALPTPSVTGTATVTLAVTTGSFAIHEPTVSTGDGTDVTVAPTVLSSLWAILEPTIAATSCGAYAPFDFSDDYLSTAEDPTNHVDDWETMDMLETITHTSIRDAGNLTQTGVCALRLPLTKREVSPSGGVVVNSDVLWRISGTLLTYPPKLGDGITDSDSILWVVQDLSYSSLDQMYSLNARNIAVAADLQDLLTVKRPVNLQDAAASRTPIYQSVYTDIPCRVQELTGQVTEERGQQGMQRRYVIYVGQRLTVQAQDQAVVGSTIYEITDYQDTDRIDLLMQINCVRKPG